VFKEGASPATVGSNAF